VLVGKLLLFLRGEDFANPFRTGLLEKEHLRFIPPDCILGEAPHVMG
jgi:hypothetical protein